MPTLHEIEHAFRLSLVERDESAAAPYILADGLGAEARLDVYRNTVVGTLTRALHLSFPAVHRLVGPAFFETAARLYMEAEPPRSACLDDYGAGFPAFLEEFPALAPVPYVPEVAQLEWAVSCALHAPDAEALDISRLSTVDPGHHDRVLLAPHPSVALLHAEHPVDEIWSAVLAEDDAAMSAIDLDAGPVHLLVHRRQAEVDVLRLGESAWRFMAALCSGQPLHRAVEQAPDIDPAATLAEHLAAGRFADFVVAGRDDAAPRQEAFR